jgi:hypothetical protein
MNERIRKLAEQAKIEFTYDPTETPMREFVEAWSGDLEKFAELIVRECAELIDNKVTITAAETYDEVFVAKFDTKELCAKQIREHFGVEE